MAQNLEMVKLLCDNGTDVNAKDFYNVSRLINMRYTDLRTVHVRNVLLE